MSRIILCLLLVAGCAVDDDATDEIFADEGPDKGGPEEKDRWLAIDKCRIVCVKKYTAMCPAMDTVPEYLVCRDACAVQTYPDACEEEYLALQQCRAAPAVAYVCNAAGQPVATTSCLTEQIALGFCKSQHQ